MREPRTRSKASVGKMFFLEQKELQLKKEKNILLKRLTDLERRLMEIKQEKAYLLHASRHDEKTTGEEGGEKAGGDFILKF